MLKPKVFAEMLSQANTGGVMSSMLLNNEGSLLAYSGSDVHKDKMITAAVSSNIWSAYEKGGKMAFHNEGLQYMFMDCQEGKVAVTKVSAALICIYAEETVGFGLLKLKLDTLAEHLKEPLSASMNQ
ncbi:ragulator complex protein LAMTOR2 [Hydra vulgaris]|uniref:Ragulator complex protein LAMTOR2-like n=1 Tax=Hydra vulgaris TaxID=6087 RepID=A0ABM4CDC1_HYDVU|nr:ragulator complex protein LAMTOR2-like [Hydra vulgaris]